MRSGGRVCMRWLVVVLAIGAASPSSGEKPAKIFDSEVGLLLDVEPVGQETNLWCWAASTQMIRQAFGERAENVLQCEQASKRAEEGSTCCPRTRLQAAVEAELGAADTGRMKALLKGPDKDCVRGGWPLEGVWKTHRSTRELCRAKYLRQLTGGREFATVDDFLDRLEVGRADRAWLEEKLNDELKTAEDCALTWDAVKRILDRQSPIAFAHRWGPASGHMMVATGYLEIADGKGTERWVAVNDPWPPGSGDRFLVSFEYFRRGETGRHWRAYWDEVGGEITAGDLEMTTPHLPIGVQVTTRDWEEEEGEARKAAEKALMTLEKLDEPQFERLALGISSAAIKADPLRVEAGVPLIKIGLDDLKVHGLTYVEKLRRLGPDFVGGKENVKDRPLEEALFPVVRGSELVSLIRVRRSRAVTSEAGGTRGEWEVTGIGGKNILKSVNLARETISTGAIASAVIGIPECYQIFVLAFSADSQVPGLVPVFDQPELGFEQGEVISPEELLSAIVAEKGACGSPLGG